MTNVGWAILAFLLGCTCVMVWVIAAVAGDLVAEFTDSKAVRVTAQISSPLVWLIGLGAILAALAQ